MMLAYKVHKPMWKEDWGMSKLLKRVVVRYEEKNEFVKEKNSNISDSWSDGDIGRSGNGKCCKSR